MKVGKIDSTLKQFSHLSEIRKNKRDLKKCKKNYINIRNRALRLNMSETMNKQKIEQMKLFLCVNKSSLYGLYEKNKQAIKEVGLPYSYRHPYFSLLIDLTKNKKVSNQDHVDFLTWQTKRLKFMKKSILSNTNENQEIKGFYIFFNLKIFRFFSWL